MKMHSEKIRHLMAVLLVGLCLALAIGLCLAPVRPARAQSAIYVDDDTCPDPGAGTEVDPFCRIQDAVRKPLIGRPAELHTPQAQFGYFQARMPQISILHSASFLLF